MKQFVFVTASLCLFAVSAPCQTVTLPVMRSGKSIEVTMLRHALLDVEKESDSLSIVRSRERPLDSLKCDLARIALSPYTKKEVARAFATSSPAAKRADTTATRALFTQELAVLTRERGRHPAEEVPRDLSQLLNKAPSGCVLAAPPTEAYVRSTIERYLEGEKDAEHRASLDSLGRIALANVIQAKLRERHWAPVHTHDQATAFWKQASSSTLNVGAISGSGDLGTAFTELTSRFLHPVRLSINTVLAAAKDTAKKSPTTTTTPAAAADTGKSETAIARFLNGGGLLNLGAAWPWLHYGNSNGAGDVIGLLSSRFGATLPVLGASAKDTTLMYDVGADFFLKSTDFVDHVGVYFQTRVGLAGGSGRFMKSIGEPNQQRTGYQTISVGLTLDEKYLITFSRTVSGPRSLQTGWQIGTTLARSAAQPSATNR